MKWKDLSLKERKQIYDSVRANNPDATYFDIKEQFDSIPEYEDGKAASAIAFQDMANRGKYVKHQQMYDSAGNPIYGRTTGKVEQPTIEDMTISLNPDGISTR